jgi:hypothetical protein
MDEDYRWNEDKNEQLLRERGLSFEMVVEAINSGGLLNDGFIPIQFDIRIRECMWLWSTVMFAWCRM